MNGDPEDENYKIARSNIRASYHNLGLAMFQKEDFLSAENTFRKAYEIDVRNENTAYWYGKSKERNGKYDDALRIYERGLDSTGDSSWIESFQTAIKDVQTRKQIDEAMKSAPTNDPFSGFQYHLRTLNVPVAWSKVKASRSVVVAVIDDGVNVNHPDLVGRIWTNAREIPGNGIDDDRNGFVDDYNGWSFVSDKYGNLLPSGTHGTMVAGIIAAKIGNGEGIAGIAKNAKIMPLRVFGMNESGASDKNIIAAINYAIDNGADIINLSLGGNQFAFSNAYDEVFRKAYSKGVVVVVAAGNGDVLSKQEEGVDTSVNKLSPVCNNAGNPKSVIGVIALDSKGYRTRWSNYGSCAPFAAPGVDIWSTSVPLFTEDGKSQYDTAAGTSFSAPQVAGIIALGYNQYGKVRPEDVYDALVASMVPNSVGNYQIDASKYLDALGAGERNAKIRKSVDAYFAKLKRSYMKSGSASAKAKFRKLYETFSVMSFPDSQRAYVLNYLLSLIRKEL